MSIHGGSMVRNQSRVLLTPGLIRQPKYCHLKELHRAIKLCEKALVSADPTVTSLGSLQQAHVLLFLSNYDTKSASRVWSIRILSECRNVIFNTAKVGFQTSQMEMLPSNADMIS